MQGLQSAKDELDELNVVVLGISADPPEKLASISKNYQFTLVGDPELKVIDQFGLRHKDASPYGGDIARPAVILLSPEGEVLFTLLTDNWRVRPTANDILTKVQSTLAK